MDQYTKTQQEWLNQRFQEHDKEGYYLAHQPIYGFRKEPSEPGHTFRYTITHHILKSLRTIDFKTFLDAGGGEGYKSRLLKDLWDVKTITLDLSEQACRRAREIFDQPGVSADLHDLPFRDDAFDVVLCSESLEHVDNYGSALDELLRVTKKTLVITVPHEEIVPGTVSEPHAHINSFSADSFNFLRERGYEVQTRKLLSPLLTIPASLADARKRVHNEAWRHPRFMTSLYNTLVPVARKILNLSTVAMLVRLDVLLCRMTPWHNGLLFVITKRECERRCTPRELSLRRVLSFSTPKHKM